MNRRRLKKKSLLWRRAAEQRDTKGKDGRVAEVMSFRVPGETEAEEAERIVSAEKEAEEAERIVSAEKEAEVAERIDLPVTMAGRDARTASAVMNERAGKEKIQKAAGLWARFCPKRNHKGRCRYAGAAGMEEFEIEEGK